MDILSWIILGGVAGWVAKVTTGVGEKRGCLFNIIIGIIGSMMGGFIFTLMGEHGVTGFNIWSLFVAAVGAILLLGIARLFGKKK